MTELTGFGHTGRVESVIRLTQTARGTQAFDFLRLYDETVDVAWRVLQRLGVREAELEDAVQDVFAVAFRRRSDFHGGSKASTWITGIAIRVAHDYRRRVGRKPTEALDQHRHLEDAKQSPDETVIRSQAGKVLLSLMDQLEPTQREVFVLAELEQLSAPEIASLTSTPVNTVYSRLRLARERFNELVENLNQGVR